MISIFSKLTSCWAKLLHTLHGYPLSHGCPLSGLFASQAHSSSYSTQNFHGNHELVLCQENYGIRTLTLNDQKTRNCLSLQMLEVLHRQLQITSDSIRVVILRSEGPVFSAGHNLKELKADNGKEKQEQIFTKCSELMLHIQHLPVPVIAQVKGLATAAGCQLAASCDIIICSDKAAFQVPGVSVGLFCSTPGVALVRVLPPKVALEMLLTGRQMFAKEALQYGMVSKVVPEEYLEQETMRVAQNICSHSRSVLALGKSFFYRQINMGVKEAYRTGGEVMVNNLGLQDGQEGIHAFTEKRKPHWNHSEKRWCDND